jgi:glycine cleavage system H lipoate-binding protein
MIGLIQKDPNGMGFCRMKDLVDMNIQGLASNVMLLPIDKNGNGKMDNFEKIYRNQEAFMRGVWLGKYPSSLSNNIYSLSSVKPGSDAEVAFLTWILTDGQKYLVQNGFFDLVSSERDTKVAMLGENTVLPDKAETRNPAQTAVFILFLVIVTGIVVAFLYRYIKIKKTSVNVTPVPGVPVFDENTISTPKGVFFDKSHTWAFMELNGDVRIGIDDFIQHVTGPITRILMKNPGEMIKKGEKIFTLIQNGKQLTIHSPVSGRIKAQNEILATNSSVINASPFSDGWVYLIEPTNWIRETQFMIMAERYTEWLRHEFTRLKDFFSISLKVDRTEYAHVVLQDGGNIHDNILAEFGPEVWEDFQTNFIDSSK